MAAPINTGFDFARLCDRVEILQSPNPDAIWAVVEAFRSQCLSKFADHDIDPVPPEVRADFQRPMNREYMLSRVNPALYRPQPLAEVLSNPRILKHALRRTHNAWHALHGEVDFDDLLVVSVLRTAASGAYNFLVENIEKVQDLERIRLRPQQGRPYEQEHQNLRTTWSAYVGFGSLSLAADNLVSFLLPGWANQPPRSRRPQGIGPSPEYWRRISAEVVDDMPRDQHVLKLILDWKRNSPKRRRLVKALRANRTAAKLEQFASLPLAPAVNLYPDELLALCAALAADALDRMGAGASLNGLPAYFGLWRSLMAKRPAESPFAWILDEAKRAMPRSLRLATDLLYYWSGPEPAFLTPTESERLYADARDLAEHEFSGHPHRFVAALDHTYPYTVRHWTNPPHAQPAPPDKVRWLVSLLLDAARTDPGRLIPHLAVLVADDNLRTSRDPGAPGPTRQFGLSQTQLNLFTPDQQTLVLELLARPDTSHQNPDVQQMLAAMREEARKRLASQRNQ